MTTDLIDTPNAEDQDNQPAAGDDEPKSAEGASMMAHVILVTDREMPLTERCDRCGAQAWVEVELESGSKLLFCSHDASKNWSTLVALPVKIADHRPCLRKQETGLRDAASAK